MQHLYFLTLEIKIYFNFKEKKMYSIDILYSVSFLCGKNRQENQISRKEQRQNKNIEVSISEMSQMKYTQKKQEIMRKGQRQR